MDANGDIKNYYYAPDWTKVTRNTKLTKFPFLVVVLKMKYIL